MQQDVFEQKYLSGSHCYFWDEGIQWVYTGWNWALQVDDRWSSQACVALDSKRIAISWNSLRVESMKSVK